MKCKCAECKGEGVIEIPCDACHGSGNIDRCISRVSITDLRAAADEKLALAELKEDAARVITQAERLIAMNPKAETSYRQQLDKTLAELNRKATEVLA